MEPYTGYWVENADTVEQTLFLRYRSCDAGTSKKSINFDRTSNLKEIHLYIESNGTADPTNILGFRDDAKDGYDIYDLGEPPQPLGKYTSLAFVQERVDGSFRLLTGDYRPDSYSGWTYDMLVRGNTNRPAYLKLSKLKDIPDNFKVFLYDFKSELSYELKLNERMTLPHIPTIKGVKYQLIVGNKQYLNEMNLESAEMPENYKLYQNYPNPFNPSTTIKFDLPKPDKVYLDIVNILGRVVRVLIDDNLPAGPHSYTWDGLNETGSKVASGVYFYRIKTERFISNKKMMLVK